MKEIKNQKSSPAEATEKALRFADLAAKVNTQAPLAYAQDLMIISGMTRMMLLYIRDFDSLTTRQKDGLTTMLSDRIEDIQQYRDGSCTFFLNVATKEDVEELSGVQHMISELMTVDCTIALVCNSYSTTDEED